MHVGANVGEGQYVLVNGLVEHAPLVRTIADVAYEAGARYVDAWYGDQHVRRAMIAKGPDEILEWTPDWAVQRLDSLGEENGALISITGDPEPELLSDLDQTRVGKTRPIAMVATCRSTRASRMPREGSSSMPMIAQSCARWPAKMRRLAAM